MLQELENTFDLAGAATGEPVQAYQASRPAFTHGCQSDPVLNHPYRPFPSGPSGELLIDPEIVLKARPMPVEYSLYYSSVAPINQELGYGRSASVRAYVASSSSDIYTVRGDFSMVLWSVSSTSGTVTNYVPASGYGGVTTLAYDSSTGIYTEYFNDGYKMLYKVEKSTSLPQKYSLANVVHPSGAMHTYSYGSGAEAGLLKTIEDASGRLVSFAYGASTVTSLLSSIEDWSGREHRLAQSLGRHRSAPKFVCLHLRCRQLPQDGQ